MISFKAPRYKFKRLVPTEAELVLLREKVKERFPSEADLNQLRQEIDDLNNHTLELQERPK